MDDLMWYEYICICIFTRYLEQRDGVVNGYTWWITLYKLKLKLQRST